MEFRSKKTARALVAVSLWLAPAALGQPFRYEVRHQRLSRDTGGTLVIDAQGVAFQNAKGTWRWPFRNIQQLEIAPEQLRVLTYQDARWKLGADREYRFNLLSSGTFADAYQFLKTRLDQRLVAALPDPEVKPVWELAAKHLLRFGGREGVLAFGRDRLVWSSRNKDESRTWRYADIDSVSSTGPFQLTITTYERALAHYGSLKGFNFQLKEGLGEDRYNLLWQRVNESKGLKFITSYNERKP
jgi:hypothetical protein